MLRSKPRLFVQTERRYKIARLTSEKMAVMSRNRLRDLILEEKEEGEDKFSRTLQKHYFADNHVILIKEKDDVHYVLRTLKREYETLGFTKIYATIRTSMQ